MCNINFVAVGSTHILLDRRWLFSHIFIIKLVSHIQMVDHKTCWWKWTLIALDLKDDMKVPSSLDCNSGLTHTMPTLGPTTCPHQWESFHLDRSSCLVCNEVICEHDEKSLLVAVISKKRCIFPMKRDLLLLPQIND